VPEFYEFSAFSALIRSVSYGDTEGWKVQVPPSALKTELPRRETGKSADVKKSDTYLDWSVECNIASRVQDKDRPVLSMKHAREFVVLFEHRRGEQRGNESNNLFSRKFPVTPYFGA
jgi:hypothetical protein